jgi:hypothetical protein
MIQDMQAQVINARESLLAALDRGESLPSQWYTDPAITTLEIEKLFRERWSYLGPARELAKQRDLHHWVRRRGAGCRDSQRARAFRFHQRVPPSQA